LILGKHDHQGPRQVTKPQNKGLIEEDKTQTKMAPGCQRCVLGNLFMS
jgi:hypothetical protein